MTFGVSDGLTFDVFPQNASCKCYFFDNMAELSTGQLVSSSDWRFNDVLRRRFLRQGHHPASFTFLCLSIHFIYKVYIFFLFKIFCCFNDFQ